MRTRMVPFDALVPRLRRVLRQSGSDTGKQVQPQGGRCRRRNGPQRPRPHDRAARAHAAQRRRARPGDRRTTAAPPASPRKARSASWCSAKVPKSCSRSATTAAAWTRMRSAARRSNAACSRPRPRSPTPRCTASSSRPASPPPNRSAAWPAAASAWTWCTAKSASSAARCGIESEVGKGSVFTIRLPFTLAVTQAVFVKIGDTSFAVPIASVQGVGRMGRAELEKQLATEHAELRCTPASPTPSTTWAG